jgi:hypothetical protein
MPNKAIVAADGHKIHRCPSIYIELENTCVRPFEVWCSEKAREEHLDQPYQLLFDTEIRLLAEDADHLSIPNHHLASEVTGHPDLQLGLELLQCRSCWCYEQSFSEFTNMKRDVRVVTSASHDLALARHTLYLARAPRSSLFLSLDVTLHTQTELITRPGSPF